MITIKVSKKYPTASIPSNMKVIIGEGSDQSVLITPKYNNDRYKIYSKKLVNMSTDGNVNRFTELFSISGDKIYLKKDIDLTQYSKQDFTGYLEYGYYGKTYTQKIKIMVSQK